MPEKFPFARRTDWDLQPNQYSKMLKQLGNAGVEILDLTQSNPTKCRFNYPSEKITSELSRKTNLSYDPSARGSFLARKAVCKYYEDKGWHLDPEQIFLTSSTSEAYSYLFRLIADSGAEILFPRPSYPLFSFLGDLNDVHVSTYSLNYDERWRIDFEQLEKNLTGHTRGIVLVNPNNPTGSYISKGELNKINSICRKSKIAIISDEVFWDYPLNSDKNAVSLIGNAGALTFVLGGLSKNLALPQMKLSWIVISGPQSLVNQAIHRLEVIADTYLSVNTPTQNALPAWLKLRNPIQDEIHGRIRGNYNFIGDQAQNCRDCHLLNSEGGWYAAVKIPKAMSEEKWVLTFLKEEHVAVHPGYFFDFTEGLHIIVSLLPQTQVFQEGIRRVFARINSNLGAASQTC